MNQKLRFSTRVSGEINLRFLGKFMATAFFLASVWVLGHQDQTIPVFADGSLEDNLKAARESDKLCYLKFYTDFCYPCDKADERLVNSSRLVKLLTENYIAAKIDGWKPDDNGESLARKFNVSTYPAIVITDGEGNVVERSSYYESESQWAEFLEKTNGLRTAPEITMVSDNGSEDVWKKQPEFGLIVGADADYVSSRETAKAFSKKWKKGVWIFPGKRGEFLTVIGPFSSRAEAKVARENVKFAHEGEVVKLDEKPVRYRD